MLSNEVLAKLLCRPNLKQQFFFKVGKRPVFMQGTVNPWKKLYQIRFFILQPTWVNKVKTEHLFNTKWISGHYSVEICVLRHGGQRKGQKFAYLKFKMASGKSTCNFMIWWQMKLNFICVQESVCHRWAVSVSFFTPNIPELVHLMIKHNFTILASACVFWFGLFDFFRSKL